MTRSEQVMVYGAGGHTGRFVVDELRRRGIEPVLAGRSAERLAGVGRPESERRVFPLDDAAELRRAMEGIAAVVNCAGPFLDTAAPLVAAAVAAGAHYLDVTAEQAVAQALYRDVHAAAGEAGVAVVPAMAFYGGLADLLVTAALDGESAADAVDVAIALDRWWPTAGTRATGARNTAPRLVVSAGGLVPLADPAPTGSWRYPEPFGDQPVVHLPFSEVIVIERHLAVGELRTHVTTAPLADLRDPTTPPPAPAGSDGRSGQQFVLEVVVRRNGAQRRLAASGRDIYAVTAPIVVEGVVRLLDGRASGVGAAAPGELFDAVDVLDALASHPFGIRIDRA